MVLFKYVETAKPQKVLVNGEVNRGLNLEIQQTHAHKIGLPKIYAVLQVSLVA